MLGCSSTPKYQVNSQLDTSKQITLKIAGSSADFKAMETMTQKFTEIYPNCKVEYEYLQDYQETLFKRLDVQNNSVDMFVTDNIQKTSANYPYALELFSHSDKLDLSNTSQELLDNYKLTDSDTDEIYAVAMGIEVRGLYVNKTLLDSLGLKIPENREEFLDSCRVLSEHGSNAVDYVKKEYNISLDKISQPDDVTFDYGFYSLIVSKITDIAKSNNPKYMKDNGTMYDFEHYMDQLKTSFEQQRQGEGSAE